MPECDSKAHHKNDQYPSTSRECLPYLHLGRQRGNPATVSVYDTAEHNEECGKDRSGNQQQPRLKEADIEWFLTHCGWNLK